jgi:hypothetical protein
MQFRVVALIALWTMIVGPVLGPPVSPSSARHPAPSAAAQPVKPASRSSPVRSRPLSPEVERKTVRASFRR